ncbi:MAG: ABC transporter substrate-binding protein [Firmicutes bacterium]|nr:ABC transporter substrate-binding protein [Bacillota bacterium]
MLTVLTPLASACGHAERQKAGLDSEKTNKAASGEENIQAEKISVNVSAMTGPTVVGMIKMFEDKPQFKDNLDVTYTVAKTPDQLVASLLSGEVNVATIPTNVAAKLYNQGKPYQVAGVCGKGVQYLLSSRADINGWEDLKGREVHATGKGATPDMVMRYLMRQNKIDPDKDVTLNYLPRNVELAQTMIADRADLAIVAEPLATKVVQQNPKVRVVMDLQQEWQKVSDQDIFYPPVCLVFKKELIEQEPGIVEAFVESYQKSIEWVNQNPDKAGALVAKHAEELPSAIIPQAIPRCNISYVDAGEARQSIEKYLKMLGDMAPETIGGKLPDDDFYYTQQPG